MRKPAVLIVLVVLALLGARPRRAAACGDATGAIMTELVVIGGVYTVGTLGFTVHDLAASERSAGYGAAEMLVNAPLTAIFGAVLLDELSPAEGQSIDRNAALAFGALTALHAVLTVNGYRAAARHPLPRRGRPRAPETAPGAVRLGSARATLGPTPVSDGRALGAGLGLVGSF